MREVRVKEEGSLLETELPNKYTGQSINFEFLKKTQIILECMYAKSLQLCPTLCDPGP